MSVSLNELEILKEFINSKRDEDIETVTSIVLREGFSKEEIGRFGIVEVVSHLLFDLNALMM